jgi:hypothetical protein
MYPGLHQPTPGPGIVERRAGLGVVLGVGGADFQFLVRSWAWARACSGFAGSAQLGAVELDAADGGWMTYQYVGWTYYTFGHCSTMGTQLESDVVPKRTGLTTFRSLFRWKNSNGRVAKNLGVGTTTLSSTTIQGCPNEGVRFLAGRLVSSCCLVVLSRRVVSSSCIVVLYRHLYRHLYQWERNSNQM